ncbi:hypothetical protein AVEN_9761-1 [Araneus ventricosus]|uniref:Uncharacterized protein n=1 Tax=Araneus ventricosus TaxID=182803 RepID=A0A4Y2UDT2_ARAVE|nr:hypothetical protein AVEN_217679-1 [Araneus ventricosus]GBO10199.1 hypothetical protein AVEN_9761-1 [Araneus ventricosus]
MAATGMVALFWMTSKLKRRQFEDSSTQTERLKTDAFTQVEVNQLCEKSTQAQEIKCDASTQVEQCHFQAKSTQTVAEIMFDKDVQTFLERSENKETQASPCLCLEKEVQTVIIPRSSKVPAHFKKQINKSKIPLTSNFLKYLDRKFGVQGRNTELAPKVDEEHGKEHDSCKLPSHDELEIQASMLGKDIADQNSSKLSAHFKKQIKKPTIPLTSNFLKYFDRKFDVQGRNTELAPKIDDEHSKEHDLCTLPSHDELKIQAPMLGKDIADQNSSKMSVFESGNSDTDDIHFLGEGKVNTANDPVPYKHEYARGYIKLREPIEKQNEPSFLKKKFQKLKKLLKI